MGPNALHRIRVEHLPKHLLQVVAEGDSAVVLLAEEDIQIIDYVQLAVEDLGEGAVVYREQATLGFVLAVDEDLGLVAQPEREAVDELDDDAAQAPDIDRRRIFVTFDIVQHLNAMRLPVLVENVVEQFRAHVLGSGQLVLLEILEDKARAVID